MLVMCKKQNKDAKRDELYTQVQKLNSMVLYFNKREKYTQQVPRS